MKIAKEKFKILIGRLFLALKLFIAMINFVGLSLVSIFIIIILVVYLIIMPAFLSILMMPAIILYYFFAIPLSLLMVVYFSLIWFSIGMIVFLSNTQRYFNNLLERS
uniref:Uncharacterized protein n=1 Tax=Meloidogyne enterolobii TaxID=390850 RepID=A0A6V7TQQ2_MELEN|nr:unnamed protein product [Meloidogyne enterolobii]